MSDLPKLPRQPTREKQIVGDKEIWHPSWRCFCCNDNGHLPLPHIVLVIPDYSIAEDKPVLCQNPGCEAGLEIARSDRAGSFDFRFAAVVCQKIDAIMRQGWKQTNQEQFDRISKKIAQVTGAKSLRTRDRSPTEEMISQQRHAAARDGWGSEAQNDEEREFLAGREYD
ncbi:hypothetical protein [Coleofasciculus sp. FACHB-501]|uniref:hypothetical protein n=1 Tax=Cyanophyceae TaxID=3028117 RepID=UPI001689B3F3|nr:hypothetical protein [Coleofasciculus sp. FACHB-501]MBD1836659.1 hypothetical protein [Coleofasciculus sp. FACHB-501]